MATNNTVANNEAKAICTENLAAITRKQAYENFKEELLTVDNGVTTATTNELANAAMNCLERILTDALGRRHLEDVSATVKDIIGSIPAVRTFDRTRAELHEMVSVLIGMIDKIIAEESAKEDVENLRNIFRLCAEHAPEIAKIIGVGIPAEA